MSKNKILLNHANNIYKSYCSNIDKEDIIIKNISNTLKEVYKNEFDSYSYIIKIASYLYTFNVKIVKKFFESENANRKPHEKIDGETIALCIDSIRNYKYNNIPKTTAGKVFQESYKISQLYPNYISYIFHKKSKEMDLESAKYYVFKHIEKIYSQIIINKNRKFANKLISISKNFLLDNF